MKKIIINELILSELLLKNENLQGISIDNVDYSMLINIEKNNKIITAKRLITTSINKIVTDKIKSFKIGRSSHPAHKRASAYIDYKKMYVLCASKSKDVIMELENYYNEMYINHKKNDNKKTGSAGPVSSLGEYFLLYMVVI